MIWKITDTLGIMNEHDAAEMFYPGRDRRGWKNLLCVADDVDVRAFGGGLDELRPQFLLGKVPLRDGTHNDSELWTAAYYLLAGMLRDGPTIVHCRAGQSRSPAVCVLFLMFDQGLQFEKAREIVYRQRPGACIKPELEQDLRALFLW